MKSINQQIKDVFSHPTAPYRENWVLQYVKDELKRLRCPYFQDKWGNIFAGVKTKTQIKNKNFLLAHTDHPGFHILKSLGKNSFSAQWHGGFPPQNLHSFLRVYHPSQPEHSVRAKITKAINKEGQFSLKILKANAPFKIDTSCFGAFDHPGYEIKKGIIHTRVADNLIGVCIILATLERLSPKRKKHFLGIFTTAEETGFKGTLGFLKDKTLPKNSSGICLEASRTLPGALIGHGAVIRLGDRKTVFSNSVISFLDEAATHLKKNKKLNFQRKLMDGGTCEATALNLSEINCGGLAIPLGNYHNQRKNGKPGPEFVSLYDVETAVALCTHYYQLVDKKSEPLKNYNKKLFDSFQKSQPLFKTKPRQWNYEK